jgi:hypothetical protein
MSELAGDNHTEPTASERKNAAGVFIAKDFRVMKPRRSGCAKGFSERTRQGFTGEAPSQ